MQIYMNVSSLIRFLGLRAYFSSWYREGDTLTNGDFLYKCQFPLKKIAKTVFQASPVLAVSQNNQLGIIRMRKRHVLGWPTLPLFIDLLGETTPSNHL